MRYSEEITDYIYKQMSPLKREAFERKLEEDPELAAEVQEQEEMLEAVRGARVYEHAKNDPQLEEAERIAKEILEERKNNTKSKGKKVWFKVLWQIPAAAAAAVLIFINWYIGDFISKDGIGKKQRARLGFKVNITENFGKSIGKGLARLLHRIRKR